MKQRELKPRKMPVMVDVWNCDDLKALISEKISAEVKDVNLAKRLEHLLADEIAYGTGGSGGVAAV